MLEQLTSCEITEMLAFYYSKTDDFRKTIERENAPKKLREIFKDKVVKRNG